MTPTQEQVEAWVDQCRDQNVEVRGGWVDYYKLSELVWQAASDAVITKLAAGATVEPDGIKVVDSMKPPIDYYTLQTLQVAIAAARLQALEEAANVCDNTTTTPETHWMISAILASNIRSLIGCNHG